MLREADDGVQSARCVVCERQSAAMTIDNRLRDGEAKAKSTRLLITRGLKPDEGR